MCHVQSAAGLGSNIGSRGNMTVTWRLNKPTPAGRASSAIMCVEGGGPTDNATVPLDCYGSHKLEASGVLFGTREAGKVHLQGSVGGCTHSQTRS